MNIAILTSRDQWFVSYARKLANQLGVASIYHKHTEIEDKYDVVFILGYHKIVDKRFLSKNKHNIVIHESHLPKGKGWSPLFWQVLEGKKDIPFTMFEVVENIDAGDVLMRDELTLSGYELNEELREKQANKIINMCIEFIKNYDLYKIGMKQIGNESFYNKRTKKDSQLDIDKTLKEQFNLLRVVNNEEYPAFFELNGFLYTIKIEKL